MSRISKPTIKVRLDLLPSLYAYQLHGAAETPWGLVMKSVLYDTESFEKSPKKTERQFRRDAELALYKFLEKKMAKRRKQMHLK